MVIGSVETLIQLARDNHSSIGQAMAKQEAALKQQTEAEVLAQMEKNWQVMKESIATGLENPQRSKGGLIGGQGRQLYDYCQSGAPLLSGQNVMEAVSYALAVAEVNATMGRIVACPTAGSCGIVPGVLKKIQELDGLSDAQIAVALMTCAGFGMVIAHAGLGIRRSRRLSGRMRRSVRPWLPPPQSNCGAAHRSKLVRPAPWC